MHTLSQTSSGLPLPGGRLQGRPVPTPTTGQTRCVHPHEGMLFGHERSGPADTLQRGWTVTTSCSVGEAVAKTPQWAAPLRTGSGHLLFGRCAPISASSGKKSGSPGGALTQWATGDHPHPPERARGGEGWRGRGWRVPAGSQTLLRSAGSKRLAAHPVFDPISKNRLCPINKIKYRNTSKRSPWSKQKQSTLTDGRFSIAAPGTQRTGCPGVSREGGERALGVTPPRQGPAAFWDSWRSGMGANVVSMATPGTEVTGILRRRTGNVITASVQPLGNEAKATCETVQRPRGEPRVRAWQEAPKEFPKRKPTPPRAGDVTGPARRPGSSACPWTGAVSRRPVGHTAWLLKGGQVTRPGRGRPRPTGRAPARPCG